MRVLPGLNLGGGDRCTENDVTLGCEPKGDVTTKALRHRR